MDLFLREAVDRIGADDALTEVDALMSWRAFGRSYSGVSSALGRGRRAMIRWYCSNAF